MSACSSRAWGLLVTEADLKSRVKTYVSERLKALSVSERQDVNWIITPVTPPNVPFEMSNAKSWQDVRLDYQSILDTHYNANPVVRLTLTDTKGIKRVTGMQVKIQAMAMVWMTKNPINAGDILKSSQLKLVPTDISRQLDMAMSEAVTSNALNQYEARVMIGAGQLLDFRKVRKIPDIQQNAAIKLIIEASPGVEVGISGIALQNGSIGETIRVRRDRDNHSKRYLSGTVIDKHRVRVHP